MNIQLQDILKFESPYLTNNGLDDLKKESLNSLKSLGFPTTKHEEWKYTNVASILNKNYNIQPESKNNNEAIKHLFFDDATANRLVFVNGKFNESLSQVITSNELLTVKPLSVALPENNDLVLQYLGKQVQYNQDAFSALNTCDVTEGVFIHVPNNKVVEEAIYVYYISDCVTESVFYQPRNLFIVGKSAQVKIVEVTRSLGTQTSFVNLVSEVSVGGNSNVNYYKIQDNSGDNFHIETTEFHQTKDSVATCLTLTVGGAITRNNLNYRLDDENCENHMNGLYLVGKNMHVDNHTVVDHLKPHSVSNELYKGVLGGNGKGVFNGKIFVREDAQKTQAYQSNKNILLSDNASMNTKPQLEIWADDVKCSHGATSGQLDDTALFYLRARGIGMDKAKALLTRAFANDVLQSVSIDSLRVQLEALVEQKLEQL